MVGGNVHWCSHYGKQRGHSPKNKNRRNLLAAQWLELHTLTAKGLGSILVYVCVLVTQSCPTLCNTLDCSPAGSSVRGTLQARILEEGAMSSSRGSCLPRDGTVFPVAPALWVLYHQRHHGQSQLVSHSKCELNHVLSLTFLQIKFEYKSLGNDSKTSD